MKPSQSLLGALVLSLLMPLAHGQVRNYPRNIFNTAETVSGTKAFSTYDPRRFDDLVSKQHEIHLQLFDTINEAAVRRDESLKYYLDLHQKSLDFIPQLAAAHYRWVFGDKSQLDWLLAQDRRGGWGRDSCTILVFGYMDEWDKTIRALKQRDAFFHGYESGATGELLSRAIAIRKTLYGEKRFTKAWKAVKLD